MRTRKPAGRLRRAACLALSAALALCTPALAAGGSGAGADIPACLTIGLLSFALGVCVTALCLRLRRAASRKNDEDAHDA